MEKAPETAANAGGAAEQAAVIDFLSRPETYPGEAASVSRIETHAAIVFLAGERAYKLKRAVKLPYLDFSALEKRHAALRRELEINATATPELYVSLLPVTQAQGGGFELGGAGEPADWLLVMRRFDQDALLDAMACKGQLSREHTIELAYTIEHFHRQAPRAANAGFAQNLSHVVEDLGAALCGPAARAAGLDLIGFLARLRGELELRLPLIGEREREGFVRRCHGDLHLKNLVLWEGKPRLFDAIEFDERLATIDVLYDLAFLLMDLWHRGLKREANLVFNHYLQRAAISELAGLELLPLFLSLRAAIRAMTGLHALAFRQGAAREAALREIESYAALAADLLTPRPPVLVAIGGISGTGKTTVAAETAPGIGGAPGALHLRTDTERKVMQGVAFNRPLPPRIIRLRCAPKCTGGCSRRRRSRWMPAMRRLPTRFSRRESVRAALCELAHRTGAAFWGFWLQADPAVIAERLAARKNGSGDASDADAAVADKQMSTVEPPQDWVKTCASGTPEAIAAAILRRLGA